MSGPDPDVIARTEDLVLAFGEKTILDGITTEIRRGEITCLLGGSGSGKSTLVKCCVGLLTPTSGRTELLGRDVHQLDEKERDRLLARVGMLFQYGALFGSMTVGDNVALTVRQHTKLPERLVDRMVRMRLAQVGLTGVMNRYPAELSGGMQKRAALARASILDPEVLFCDEPSAGLDPVVAAGIDDLLLLFARTLGISVVAITHELASIERIADRVLMLGDRKLIADGTLDEVKRSRDPRVRAFFDREPPASDRIGPPLLEEVRG